MTLQSSPPISMSDISTELGQSLPLSLTQTNARTLAGIPSGPISILDFLGKSNVKYSPLVVGNDSNDQNSVWGFSDGGGNDGPPLSEATFGSLNGIGGGSSPVGGYTMNAIYECDDGNGYMVTRLSYGYGFLNGHTLRFRNSAGTTIADVTLSVYFQIEGTQSYRWPAFGLASYLGQSVQVGLP